MLFINICNLILRNHFNLLVLKTNTITELKPFEKKSSDRAKNQSQRLHESKSFYCIIKHFHKSFMYQLENGRCKPSEKHPTFVLSTGKLRPMK